MHQLQQKTVLALLPDADYTIYPVCVCKLTSNMDVKHIMQLQNDFTPQYPQYISTTRVLPTKQSGYHIHIGQTRSSPEGTAE